MLEVGTNKGGHLVSHDLSFHRGLNISLTLVESDVLIVTSKGDLMPDWLELQSRALFAGHFLNNEISHESTKELEILKRKLVDSSSSLKTALESNVSLNDQVKKLTEELMTSQANIDDLKVRCVKKKT